MAGTARVGDTLAAVRALRTRPGHHLNYSGQQCIIGGLFGERVASRRRVGRQRQAPTDEPPETSRGSSPPRPQFRVRRRAPGRCRVSVS